MCYHMARSVLKKGFTLIEVLVTVGILAILTSIIFAAVGNARTKAQDVARIAQLNDISGALTLYYLDYKKYPQVGQVCAQQNDDNDPNTDSDDDSPVSPQSSVLTTSECIAQGYQQSYQNVLTPTDFGCSGDGVSDPASCGWSVNRNVSPSEIHALSGGTCPAHGDLSTKWSVVGGTTPSGALDPTFPTSAPSAQTYTGDFLDNTSSIIQTLFNQGYLNRSTEMPHACYYAVNGKEDLDDGDGVAPWNGNVRSYLLFCNLEAMTDQEKSDGGFNDSLYEIYSPGTRKFCVTSSN